MDNENKVEQKRGRYLACRGQRPGRLCRWMQVTMLLVWDGILLYMIVDCLIAPAYGAAFVGIVSVYLGYQL